MQQGRNEDFKKQKPITVKITEFRKKLNQAVAESDLPPFMAEILLGEFLTGVSQLAAREYAQERQEWEQMIIDEEGEEHAETENQSQDGESGCGSDCEPGAE